MGVSFTTAAGLRQRSLSRRTHDHILLSQIRDSPNLEGQVPVFISHRNRVTQLYTQALGSRFVTSYDTHGYGGGIRNRLHRGHSTPKVQIPGAFMWDPWWKKWYCSKFISEFFCFPLLIMIPPLFHTHPSTPTEARDSSDHAAHYHISCL
jgi:hypothetical protein